MISNIVDISWDAVEYQCRKLVYELNKCCVKFERIVPVMRGGLVPATMISHLTDKKIACAISMAFPDFIQSRQEGILIVDDICDTGQTFKALKKAFPNAIFVAPYVKEAGRQYCNYYSQVWNNNYWLHFPWEITND